jgi:hypothetical protein
MTEPSASLSESVTTTSGTDDDYAMRVIAARCGDDVAGQVVPASLFVLVMDVLHELEERVQAVADAVGGGFDVRRQRGHRSGLKAGQRPSLWLLAAVPERMTPTALSCLRSSFLTSFGTTY